MTVLLVTHSWRRPSGSPTASRSSTAADRRDRHAGRDRPRVDAGAAAPVPPSAPIEDRLLTDLPEVRGVDAQAPCSSSPARATSSTPSRPSWRGTRSWPTTCGSSSRPGRRLPRADRPAQQRSRHEGDAGPHRHEAKLLFREPVYWLAVIAPADRRSCSSSARCSGRRSLTPHSAACASSTSSCRRWS